MQKQQIRSYTMHKSIEKAFQLVHDWFSSDPELCQYDQFDRSSASRVLRRENLLDAAYNFNYYFPTHYFKACHTLQSDGIIGFSKLGAWMRYNPYLTIIDVGCGDGAGTVAVIETLLHLREKGQIDPRPIQIYCVGIDPNLNGLSIYEKMMHEVAGIVSGSKIEVSFQVCPYLISQSSGQTEKILFDLLRDQWHTPSLGHSILILSNLTDILHNTYQQEQAKLQLYANLISTYSPEPFGEQLSTFVRQIFEGVPIDHLHILSIDTEPDMVRPAVEEMVLSLELRANERGHISDNSYIQLEEILIENPRRSYWKDKEGVNYYQINPFIVSVCNIHNQELNLDERWQKITSQENLELAWARARQEMLRGSLSDEIEIRLFEQDLETNLNRLHFELDAYAIHAGYMTSVLGYAFPKGWNKERPMGLTWLEEEILMIAIIQVIGINALEQKPWSYAYRLSPENSLERGATEYFYEWWTNAWKTFRQDIEEYAQNHLGGIVIKTDIKSYFTRILQDQLNKFVKEELHISKRIEWLIELLVSKNLSGHDPGRGLVQGSVGSGFMANLYLSPLDSLFPVNDTKQRRLFRYVDDIVVIVPNKADENTTKEYLFETISELELEVNQDKTETYCIEHFLSIIIPDEILDNLHERYEELFDSLWYMSEDIRDEFKEDLSKKWWSNIFRYRACLIELGLFISEARLSRVIARELLNDNDISLKLEFPELPFIATIAEAQDWSREFQTKNQIWDQDVNNLRSDIEELFQTNLLIISESNNNTHQHAVDIASRRLRFAANRLGILGLGNIHEELTNLLCNAPWLIRDHLVLIEELARQGYSRDIWILLEYHEDPSRKKSVYLSAIILRALRFLPRLENIDWQQLIKHMFVGDIATKLMATETWILLTANMQSIPFANNILKRVKPLFNNDNLPIRRLLKNYLLVLGKLDPNSVEELDFEYAADPMLLEAYKIASTGLVPNLFYEVEPEIIRQKYYSAKYRYLDEGSEGSI